LFSKARHHVQAAAEWDFGRRLSARGAFAVINRSTAKIAM